jgi:glycosyltransferase 2 family protein
MKGQWIFWAKVIILLAVAVMVGYQLDKAWRQVEDMHLAINWLWGGVALAGFTGSMITGSLVWRWLAWRMGDRARTLPLLGAYTYSQMGKYIPGKVVLLLMRIERTTRYGMTPAVATLSTLLENALYMISGGLVGMLAIVRIADDVKPQYRPLLWPVTVAAVVLLVTACAPPVFYRLVNGLLRKMKKPEVPPQDRLGAGTLAVAVVAFIPCWLFGGLAMWGSCQCVQSVPLSDCWWFAGAYALSVIIGMASLLPGGAGIREAALGTAAALQFTALGVESSRAVLLGTAVAILQRIFQVLVEVMLGLMGMSMTRTPATRVDPRS